MLSERRAISNSPHTSDVPPSDITTPDNKLSVYSPEAFQGSLFPRTQKDSRQCLDGMSSFSISPAVDPFAGPGLSCLTSSNFNLQRFGCDFTKPATSNESPERTVNYAGLPTPNTNSRPSKFHFPGSANLASPFSLARSGLGFSKGGVELPYFAPKYRAFAVEGVSPAFSHLNVASLFSRREFESVKGPYLSELNTIGKFVVAFTDLRDTEKALEKIQVTHPQWIITPLLAREYAQESKGSTESISDFEGQISITAVLRDHGDLGLPQMASLVQGLVKSFGSVHAFKAIPANTANEFLVEYCDTTDSINAVAALTGACVENVELGVKHVRPDIESISGSLLQQLLNTKEKKSPMMSSPFQLSGCTRDHRFVLSPTGRSTLPMDDISEIFGLISPMQKGSDFDALPQHVDGRLADQRPKHPQNVVNVDRIHLGLDVRTTIMLRNIPNKVDLSLLKKIVDETSFGKYDFMYLRIDFANNCKFVINNPFPLCEPIIPDENISVGYAFINFEDPIDIIPFVEARAGCTWNCFNSDKVAEVSYATIQGRDCLIQKFRNSSVMLEDPSFRPKLFYTGTGVLAGTEEPFPGPNNMSKMRRSVENAEQVGLFAPRMSRDVRRGQGVVRSDAAAAMFLRNVASSPQRQDQSQRAANLTPITSPVAQRHGA